MLYCFAYQRNGEKIMIANLLISSWDLQRIICIPCLIISVLCAIFLIIVIMLQPSNSDGISALNGQQETFFGNKKNKSKTLEYKLRRLTVITVTLMAICMIVFFVAVFNIKW